MWPERQLSNYEINSAPRIPTQPGANRIAGRKTCGGFGQLQNGFGCGHVFGQVETAQPQFTRDLRHTDIEKRLQRRQHRILPSRGCCFGQFIRIKAVEIDGSRFDSTPK